VAHQPSQRNFIHDAIAERRDERQPEAVQVRAKAERFRVGCHGSSPDWPETGHKKPHLAAGVSKIGRGLEVYRARRSEAPEREAFFIIAVAHAFVIMGAMMRCAGSTVNERAFSHHEKFVVIKNENRKKAGLRRARL
jgi:hypothetical protein